MLFVSLLLTTACGSADDADSGGTTHGIAEWSTCVDYPTGVVTCADVCADEGKVCAARQCDGYTAMRYTMPSCSNIDDGKDYDCDEEFDVTTSSYTSAECCCW